MSLSFGPSVRAVYALACSPTFGEITPDDVTSALRADAPLVDNAARDLLATFAQVHLPLSEMNV